MSEPLFTYTVRGWQRQVTPKGAKGWLALSAYVGLVIALGFTLLPWLLARSEWLVIAYLTAVGLLTWAFIAWAISRSERIDLDMSARELAEFRDWKRRGKR